MDQRREEFWGWSRNIKEQIFSYVVIEVIDLYESEEGWVQWIGGLEIRKKTLAHYIKKNLLIYQEQEKTFCFVDYTVKYKESQDS